MADPALFTDHENARQAGEVHAVLTAQITILYGKGEKLH
jgi:hypothetical protein